MAIFTADRGRIDSYKIDLGELVSLFADETPAMWTPSRVRRAELSPETVPAARGTSPL